MRSWILSALLAAAPVAEASSIASKPAAPATASAPLAGKPRAPAKDPAPPADKPTAPPADGSAPAAGKPEDAGLVDVSDRIPDAILDFRYATDRNFMKRAVYPPDARCLLRRKTAEKLSRVADRLRAEDGTRLLLFDCYRPLSVQRKMWEAFPVRGYVAPPSGGSVHNRGAAIDLGLASKDGTPLPMPTDFDTFDERAWQSYEGATAGQKRNRARLRDAMRAEGFTPIRKEWWHYEDPDERRSPVLDIPFARGDGQ